MIRLYQFICFFVILDNSWFALRCMFIGHNLSHDYEYMIYEYIICIRNVILDFTKCGGQR